jgi:16S rRNA processing protein RimM
MLMKEERQLVVGFVRASHGVTGEFKVESASGYYEHLEVLKEVTLRNGSVEKACTVESASIGNGTLYMKLAEINSPEEVQKYRNWELLVPEKYAHKPGKDEWYIEDLKGCSLIWDSNRVADGTAPAERIIEEVGTITDVLEGGAGYLLEVSISESCKSLSQELKVTSSGKARSVMVPLNYQHISDVDVRNKTIQLMHLWILE